VHRIGWNGEAKEWFEWGVTWRGDRFTWREIPKKLSSIEDSCWPRLPRELLEVLPHHFTSELSLAAGQWWQQAARSLQSGKLLTIDYGLVEQEFFSPSRAGGTLRAYNQHHLTD